MFPVHAASVSKAMALGATFGTALPAAGAIVRVMGIQPDIFNGIVGAVEAWQDDRVLGLIRVKRCHDPRAVMPQLERQEMELTARALCAQAQGPQGRFAAVHPWSLRSHSC